MDENDMNKRVANGVKIVITGVVSIVIQFGLATVGWGRWSAFFAHPALQALAWVAAGLTVLAVPSGGGMNKGEKEDRSNRWVLGAFSVMAPLVARIRAEERLLREHFGSEYDAYRVRTWRLLPGIY